MTRIETDNRGLAERVRYSRRIAGRMRDNRPLAERVRQVRAALDKRPHPFLRSPICPDRAVAVSASLPDPRAVKTAHPCRDRATSRTPYLGA